MRALVCHTLSGAQQQFSGLEVRELPSPKASPGEVRIRVRAAGVNFADSLVVAGLYQEKPALPFVPGMECAGEVIEGGHFEPGDRVVATVRIGAFAEEIVTSPSRVHRIPDNVSFEVAAGFPVAYGTAHLALDHRARLKRDETLVVHGAAGGVGLAAVEIGKAMGARVIATASTREKLALAREHGAVETVDTSTEDLRARLKELTDGKGADVVFDPVGGDVFDVSVRALAWEGRLVVIGFAGGRIPQAPANLLLVKNAAVLGLYWGAYLDREPHLVAESFEKLFAMLSRGVLKPHVSETFPLDRAAEALDRLSSRKATGKVVITL